MILACVFNFFIGSFVYLKNKKELVNKLFGIYCLILTFWVFGCFMESTVRHASQALFWDKLLYTGCILAAPIYLHLTFAITRRRRYNFFIPVSYATGAVWLMFNYLNPLRNYFIQDVIHKYTFRFIAVPGPLWYVFMLWFNFLVLVMFYNLYSNYKESKGHEQTKAKYLLAAFLIMITAGSFYFILLLNIVSPPIDPYLLIIYGSIMAYAIVRHQLMEIEVIIKKTLVFAGLFASALAIFILPTLVIQEFIVAQMSLAGRLAGLSISTALIVLVLKPLENFLIRITDRFLFQKKYDYKSLLKTFTTEVLTVLDLNRLTRLTVYKLADIMKMVSCGVLLFNEERDAYTLVASVGIREKGVSLGKENTLASFMERTRAYLSIRQEGKDSPLPENIKRDMNTLKVDLAIPLTLHDRMIGILTFGKKKSDEPYNQDDIDILLPLARTLSIAISNAELFDELSKTQAEAAQREKMAVIGTLSAGINHEICNPLGIVRGQCEAFMLNLKDGFYKDKTKEQLLDKAMDIMRKTIKEVDRATAVTKRLSSFAKPIKEIKLDEVNINDEINEVMALVGHELKLEKIDLIKDIPPDLPNIVADRKQIEEIFFNLIRNAGQAIGERGRIAVKARMTYNSRILIEIEDTGHGIPEDKLEQIFNPFYTTKEPGKGTGLGLFIVRQIVEKNKGKISVRSKVGTGTTFTLEFPAAVKAEV